MFPILAARPIPPWTPRRLPALALWLSSEYGVSSTDAAAEFSGANQYLLCADNAAQSVSDITFFAGGVFSFDALGVVRGLVGRRSSGTARDWAIFYDTNNPNQNRIKFRLYNAAGTEIASVATPNALSTDTRYFVLGYHDAAADQIGISIDGGAFVTAATGGAAPGDVTANFLIGILQATTTNPLDGTAEKVFFGKSPTSTMTAIRDLLYNAGSPLPYAVLTTQQKTDLGLVNFYPLDDASAFDDALGANDLTNNNGVTVRTRSLALEDGIGISTVTDRSSQANHAAQSVPTARPTYRTAIFGTKPAIRFDGADDAMSLTEIALTGDFTLTLTVKSVVSGAYMGHSTGTGKAVQTDNVTLTLTNDAGSALAITHLELDAGVHEIALVRSGSTVTRYLDGQEDGSGALSGTITLDRLGVVGTTTTPLSADVADVIIYDRAYT
jgi:hypothetical protein